MSSPTKLRMSTGGTSQYFPPLPLALSPQPPGSSPQHNSRPWTQQSTMVASLGATRRNRSRNGGGRSAGAKGSSVSPRLAMSSSSDDEDEHDNTEEAKNARDELQMNERYRSLISELRTISRGGGNLGENKAATDALLGSHQNHGHNTSKAAPSTTPPLRHLGSPSSLFTRSFGGPPHTARSRATNDDGEEGRRNRSPPQQQLNNKRGSLVALTLSDKLISGVPGKGMHRHVRERLVEAKQQTEELVARGGLEAVLGHDGSFLQQLRLRKTPGALAPRTRYIQTTKPVEVSPHVTITPRTREEVLQRRQELECDRLAHLSSQLALKRSVATMTGASANFCARHFLTWIKLLQASRILANALVSAHWSPFDEEKRRYAMFHPQRGSRGLKELERAGKAVHVAVFRWWLRRRHAFKIRAVALLIDWMKQMHYNMKLKFAVHHYLARVRRIQRGLRRVLQSRRVRPLVWSRQLAKEEKKVLALLALQRDDEVLQAIKEDHFVAREGGGGGGGHSPRVAAGNDAPPSPSSGGNAGVMIGSSKILDSSNPIGLSFMTERERRAAIHLRAKIRELRRLEADLLPSLAQPINKLAQLLYNSSSSSSSASASSPSRQQQQQLALLQPAPTALILAEATKLFVEKRDQCDTNFGALQRYIKRRQVLLAEDKKWKQQREIWLTSRASVEVEDERDEEELFKTLGPRPTQPVLPHYLTRLEVLELLVVVHTLKIAQNRDDNNNNGASSSAAANSGVAVSGGGSTAASGRGVLPLSPSAIFRAGTRRSSLTKQRTSIVLSPTMTATSPQSSRRFVTSESTSSLLFASTEPSPGQRGAGAVSPRSPQATTRARRSSLLPTTPQQQRKS